MVASQKDTYMGTQQPQQEAKSIKHDEGKTPYHLLSPQVMEEFTKVLQFGAKKYGDHNWLKPGLNYSRPYAAIHRHLSAFWQGEDIDRDTNLHHLACVMCETMFLLHYELSKRNDLDDRAFSHNILNDVETIKRFMRNELDQNGDVPHVKKYFEGVAERGESKLGNAKVDRAAGIIGCTSGQPRKVDRAAGDFLKKSQEQTSDTVAGIIGCPQSHIPPRAPMAPSEKYERELVAITRQLDQVVAQRNRIEEAEEELRTRKWDIEKALSTFKKSSDHEESGVEY